MPLLLVVGPRNKVVCSRHIVLETKEICAESEKSKRPQSIWLAAWTIQCSLKRPHLFIDRSLGYGLHVFRSDGSSGAANASITYGPTPVFVPDDQSSIDTGHLLCVRSAILPFLHLVLSWDLRLVCRRSSVAFERDAAQVGIVCNRFTNYRGPYTKMQE